MAAILYNVADSVQGSEDPQQVGRVGGLSYGEAPGQRLRTAGVASNSQLWAAVVMSDDEQHSAASGSYGEQQLQTMWRSHCGLPSRCT